MKITREKYTIYWVSGILLFSMLVVGTSGGGMGRSVHAAPVKQSTPGDVVISEFRTNGPNGATDEFIELFNQTSSTKCIENWQLKVLTSAGNEAVRATIPTGVAIGAKSHYLIANNGYGGTADLSYNIGIVDSGGIAVFDSTNVKIDSIGTSSSYLTYAEGTYLTALTGNYDRSYERTFDSGLGIYVDTDNNFNDFQEVTPSTPEYSGGSGPTCGYSPLDVVISEVAWAGTEAYFGDEWIELYNPSNTRTIQLDGWILTNESGSFYISFGAGDLIGTDGYFLIEHGSGNATSVTEQKTYINGLLSDAGETLTLLDNTRQVIDTANLNGGAWPAGNSSSYASMERGAIVPDSDFAWVTYDPAINPGPYAKDAAGNDILGTPGGSNKPSNVTATPTFTATPTYTSTPTATGTPTATFTLTPTPTNPLTVVINEVAWGGTQASSDDEWIELYNPSSTDINLENWTLKAADGSPNISLSGVILAGDYFVLERTDDDTILDITADLIYTGSLSNSGETLRLYDLNNSLVDTANLNGGSWPAGNSSSYASMERGAIVPDSDFAWVTYDPAINPGPYAKDAAGNDILGTPGGSNKPSNVTATPTFTATPTYTSTSTATSTPTATFTLTPTPTDPLTVVINEVAWGGTQASSDDEWIELYNPGSTDINLENWTLKAADGSPNISLSGVILAGDYFVLERTDDDTILDITADLIYTGSLSNSGETLRLYDLNNNLIDTSNLNGGAWPAGNSSSYASMERSLIKADSDFVWVTYDNAKDDSTKFSHDAANDVIKGTPGRANRPNNVTPTVTLQPTPYRTAAPAYDSTPVPVLGISEFLPRPGHDWNSDGQIDVYDEFIEIINAGVIDVDLKGYKLDDEQDLGSPPYTLPGPVLKPGERTVFYGAETGILLSDAGDTVRLLKSNKIVVDAYTYKVVRYPDQSWCRIPDRLGYWNDPCFPTPGNSNALTGKFPLSTEPGINYRTPTCLMPDNIPIQFTYGECSNGGGIWNRQYWEGNGQFELWIFSEDWKWGAIFQ